MGKNPPANAGTPSTPGPWKLHVPRSSEARGAQLLSPLLEVRSPRAQSLCSRTREAPARSPRPVTRERPQAATKIEPGQKINE